MALYFKRLDGKPQAYRKGCGKAATKSAIENRQ
jgi:hypothetical protein